MARRQSDLERYCRRVVKGDIKACKKVVKVCGKLLDDLHDTSGEWRFDEAKANRAVEFIERFTYIPSGKLGQPFVLELYEKAWIQAIFGFVDANGLRRFQEVLIIVGRKNGKTSLMAAIELYMLVADGEGAPQVYNVANTEEQANLGFKACLRMFQQSRKLQKRVSKREKDLYNPSNFGYIKPMASNPKALDGLDVHCAVIDELGAMENRDIYDLVKQGMASRSQPLLLCITTNGFVRNCIFDSQYDYACRWLEGDIEDERFLAFVYELDDREEWKDEDAWVKANPGLGTVKKVEFLRNGVQKAKNDPTYLPTLLTKDFNIPENSAVAWLQFEEAVNEETFDLAEMGFTYGIVGFDASETVDLTSAQMLLMRPGDERIYEISMHWLPEEVIRLDSESGNRRGRDGVPYQAWMARGLMSTTPGNKIDKRCLLDWLQEIEDEYGIYAYAIGYDPWHVSTEVQRDYEQFVGKGRAREVRQGPKTLTQPMHQLKADLKANRIVDNHNPMNEWARMNVVVKVDVNGNMQPEKKNSNGAKRIDPFMAELCAYTTLYEMYDEYQEAIR